MTTQVEGRTIPAVAQHRGQQIARRREALGLSVSELARHAHIDRSTLSNVEDDKPTVRPATYGAVESALSRLEEEMGMDAPAPPSRPGPTEELVEFRISGNFGVDVVVKGPVQDMAQLEASVARLVRQMQTAAPDES